jgi:hypothetical protein
MAFSSEQENVVTHRAFVIWLQSKKIMNKDLQLRSVGNALTICLCNTAIHVIKIQLRFKTSVSVKASRSSSIL